MSVRINIKEHVDNRFMVGVQGDLIVMLRPPFPPRLSKVDALNLAAYLVALADDFGDFPALLAAVEDS